MTIFEKFRKTITTTAAVVVTVGGVTTAVTAAVVWIEDIKKNSANACEVGAKLKILDSQLKVLDLHLRHARTESNINRLELQMERLTSGPDIVMTREAIERNKSKLTDLQSELLIRIDEAEDRNETYKKELEDCE